MKNQLLPNFTKQEFIEILEEMIHKIKTNKTELPKVGKCLIEFLYKHQDTQTFEEFFKTFAFTKLKMINNGIQDYNRYLKSNTPWEAIFEDIVRYGEIDFIEIWIEEEDRELFYQFLEKEHGIILIPQEERFIKIIEKYLTEIEKLRKYQFYWEKENKHQRLFDEYITFVYNNPNSKTAKKLLKIFTEKGNKFLENLKSQINNNNHLRIIKNLVDKEDIKSFTTLLRSKTIQKIAMSN